jgi:threonyl-tRNA synthetase
MFFVQPHEGEEPLALKPMNCPGHMLLFGSQLRSYRDLPIRYAEQGLVHRHEPSGTLHCLLRVRHITQDDAHVFCTEEQIEEEAMRCLDFGFYVYEQFGLKPRLELSTRPEKRVGTEEMWDKAEAALQRTLERNGLEYELNEGDGAFYGPKIDAHITDAIGRSWQLGTVQLDYYMPEQFQLAYTGADNAEHRPVMIHRALMGSFERFIGILIEHYAGEFPLWLAPIQAIVLPISDRHLDYAHGVARELSDAGIRAEIDERTESVGKKIREAELRKIPYMLVVGDQEQADGAVAVRRHREGDTGAEPVSEFARRISAAILARE